ncbi:WW domain-containing protein [Cinnamomum micranthum f. kanehirae]|uniref:WW domain-containing protein n=1 Tax=Cinnamomum micranthum f. kanehirae TaxID=337451 RepID=A0A3S3LUS3_9MAGN|nr:WW domain-containing protein [Cinnamomum micranthum f. kanehirae]
MMVKEFTFQQRGVSSRKEEDKERKEMRHWRVMESPELSLGPSGLAGESADGFSPMLAVNHCRKRKSPWDHLKSDHPMIQSGFQLQPKKPLDREQCLDFEEGRMYYMNRNTSKKTCYCPKDQKLDLDLNISTLSNSIEKGSDLVEDPKKPSNSNTNMVAVACFKCHLLVMLHRSSPTCPNCKYLHSFPTKQGPHPNTTTRRPMETLSLLN